MSSLIKQVTTPSKGTLPLTLCAGAVVASVAVVAVAGLSGGGLGADRWGADWPWLRQHLVTAAPVEVLLITITRVACALVEEYPQPRSGQAAERPSDAAVRREGRPRSRRRGCCWGVPAAAAPSDSGEAGVPRWLVRWRQRVVRSARYWWPWCWLC